jgi:hypothetical protein
MFARKFIVCYELPVNKNKQEQTTKNSFSEFQSLWGRTGQINLGQKHIVDQSVLPDIFISYHWGKLKQVCFFFHIC